MRPLLKRFQAQAVFARFWAVKSLILLIRIWSISSLSGMAKVA